METAQDFSTSGWLLRGLKASLALEQTLQKYENACNFAVSEAHCPDAVSVDPSSSVYVDDSAFPADAFAVENVLGDGCEIRPSHTVRANYWIAPSEQQPRPEL